MLQQNTLSLRNGNLNHKVYLTITIYKVENESEFIIQK